MFKTLAKFLLPVLGGGGIVVLTMHLTNINGSLLNVPLLDLQNKPEVDEEEIIPKMEQQESPPSSDSQKPEKNSEESNKDQQEDTEQTTQQDQSQQTQSQASVTTTSGTATGEDVIRDCAQTINTNALLGTSGDGYNSLLNIYKIESTVNRFLSAAAASQANQNNTSEQK